MSTSRGPVYSQPQESGGGPGTHVAGLQAGLTLSPLASLVVRGHLPGSFPRKVPLSQQRPHACPLLRAAPRSDVQPWANITPLTRGRPQLHQGSHYDRPRPRAWQLQKERALRTLRLEFIVLSFVCFLKPNDFTFKLDVLLAGKLSSPFHPVGTEERVTSAIPRHSCVCTHVPACKANVRPAI